MVWSLFSGRPPFGKSPIRRIAAQIAFFTTIAPLVLLVSIYPSISITSPRARDEMRTLIIRRAFAKEPPFQHRLQIRLVGLVPSLPVWQPTSPRLPHRQVPASSIKGLRLAYFAGHQEAFAPLQELFQAVSSWAHYINLHQRNNTLCMPHASKLAGTSAGASPLMRAVAASLHTSWDARPKSRSYWATSLSITAFESVPSTFASCFY